MKRIIVKFGPGGSVKIEAEGFEGQECLKATLPLEEAFGQVVDRTMKDEAIEVVTSQEDTLER